MADWRARGFVPDSDEEEEGSQNSEPRSALTYPEVFHNNLDPHESAGNVVGNRINPDGGLLRDTLTVQKGNAVSKERNNLRTEQDERNGFSGAGLEGIGTKTNNGESDSYRQDVPCQDDDMDELGQDHYHLHPVTSPTTVPNLAEAAQEISDQPLAPSPVRSSKCSRSTSVLSSLPSSPGAIAHSEILGLTTAGATAQSLDANTDPTRNLSESAGNRDISVVIRPQVHRKPEPSRRESRSLRQRNPIQLHPYAIESEKYRQSLKARGVKPLHILNTQSDQASAAGYEPQAIANNGNEESQSISDYDTSGGRSSPRPEVKSRVPSSFPDPNEALIDEDDELPDLASLLRSRPPLYASTGNKRRKTGHTFSKKRRSRTTISTSSSSRHVDAVAQMNENIVMSDTPASPPLSTHPYRSDLDVTAPRFRIPRGITPIGLPTPLTSSEPRERTQPRSSDREKLDEPADFGDELYHSESASSAEDEQLVDETAKDIERVQRKIRGVLPASWLRLDQKGQAASTRPVHRGDQDQSLNLPEFQRGVAKVISRRRRKNPTAGRSFAIELSSDGDSERGSESSESLPELDLHPGAICSVVQDPYPESSENNPIRYGDVEEDNRVDAMLPSLGRHNTGVSRRSKKRLGRYHQPKAATSSSAVYKARKHCQRQPKMTDHFGQKSRASKLEPPWLSVLDIVTTDTEVSPVTPKFLRIASRTARSRNDKGRHSPTSKILKLATHDDTNDIDRTLRKWQDGEIRPRRLYREEMPRKPLQPRSGNGELRKGSLDASTVVAQKTTNPKSSSAIAGRRIRKSQSSLDRVVLRGLKNRTEPQSRSYKFAHYYGGLKELSTRREVSSTLRLGDQVRPATLETLQEVNDNRRPEVAFRTNLLRINRLDRAVGTSDLAQSSSPHEYGNSEIGHSRDQKQPNQGDAAQDTVTTRKRTKPYRRKQCHPKHVNLDNPHCRQASEPLISNAPLGISSRAPTTIAPGYDGLYVLGQFDSRYSSDFGISPLPAGTRFHVDTLLGSGDFHRSTALSQADRADEVKQPMILQLSSGEVLWSYWNDQVSTEMGEVFDEILHSISSLGHVSSETAEPRSAMLLQRCLITYASGHLSFFDPVDRVGFLRRCLELNASVPKALSGVDLLAREPMVSRNPLSVDWQIQLGTLNLVFANQVSQVAGHVLVPADLKEKADALTMTIVRNVLSLVVKQRLAVFDRCLRDLQQLGGSEHTISASQTSLEAFVICYHIVCKESPSLEPFWQIVSNVFPIEAHDEVFDIRSLEERWRSLFNLLPFLEFSPQGILEVGGRFKVQSDDWTTVKDLIAPFLKMYMARSASQRASYNPYCRAVFARCFNLISDWNWARCESIIGKLFDFFARNKLNHLRNEECHGSPAFLEHLADNPCLTISASDRCFHILLKVIAKGLQQLRLLYPAKKIRDVVWRLMPNHGRSHPREEAIRREDLDALRNHHDLLCTLYWASPPEFRPRLIVLRNLVHLETSHREACHLNIRAWSYLVQFQLSVEEPLSSLQPFADWYDDILVQILRQHAQARTEGEEQARMADLNSMFTISKDLLETTIARNQQQVEAILGDALVCLQRAFDCVKKPEALCMLLTPTLDPVFDLFNARHPRGDQVIMEALDVVLAFVKHVASRPKQRQCEDVNDDSQDYGDWSFAEEDVSHEGSNATQALAAVHLHNILEGPLRRLLSNCFGADTPPTEGLMIKVVNVWTIVASLFVNHNIKEWSDYLSPFGQDAWCSLRETQQTRKFGAYCLACLIGVNEDIYFDHREYFLRSWIESLVERESMLKFQNQLTSAILNVDTANPLLKNLPFWTGNDTTRFDISPSDFSLRRLSLITSVFSNMRESVDNATYNLPSDAATLKLDYQNLLKHLMVAMKHNYQELGSASNVRGAYVDFAQRVVESMQQHTSSICPVDRFFTDSSSFPLPIGDPFYVVGQLRNYGLRLQDSRTPKQLAIFLQSVAERAATEGQQQYLVDQLCTAMAEFELGNSRKPTLRAFLVQSLLPAYFELAVTTSCGWILLSPFLQASRHIFDDFLGALDGTESASLVAVTSTIDNFLQSVRRSLQLLVEGLSVLQLPEMLHLLGDCFATVTALLPTLDYIHRLGSSVGSSIDCINYLRSFALFISQVDTSYSPIDSNSESQPRFYLSDVQGFALQELKESLTNHWAQHESHIYVTRGNSRKEVVVSLGTNEEERNGLEAAIRNFFNVLEYLPAFRHEDEDAMAVKRRREIGIGDVLI